MSVASRNSVFVGLGGQVAALDRITGVELWRTRIRSAGGQMTLVGDGRYLYAGIQGLVCCLDPATGSILWKNPLRGLGLGPVALWPMSAAAVDGAIPPLTSVKTRSGRPIGRPGP